MSKRKEITISEDSEDDSYDIYLNINENEAITNIIEYFNTNSIKGILYILKQINEFFDIRLLKKYIIDYLIQQNNLYNNDTISSGTNRITLQLTNGKYTIGEKRKITLINTIIRNNLWIKYIDFIITLTGTVFSNIKNILYLFKLNPIYIYNILKDIFKPFYLHQYIDTCKINISKKMQYSDIVEHIEKEKLIKSFWNNVCVHSIKIKYNNSEEEQPEIQFQCGIELKNSFVYKSDNKARNQLIQKNRNLLL